MLCILLPYVLDVLFLFRLLGFVFRRLVLLLLLGPLGFLSGGFVPFLLARLVCFLFYRFIRLLLLRRFSLRFLLFGFSLISLFFRFVALFLPFLWCIGGCGSSKK